MARFSGKVLDAIRDAMIIGIQAGKTKHRVIGIWAVVVENRVFVRSWGVKPGGWYDTFLETPCGVLHIANRAIPIRTVRTRSERLKDAVDLGYAEKYSTPGSVRWVKDLRRKKSKETTTELVPLK